MAIATSQAFANIAFIKQRFAKSNSTSREIRFTGDVSLNHDFPT
jgi:hypothetical protein